VRKICKLNLNGPEAETRAAVERETNWQTERYQSQDAGATLPLNYNEKCKRIGNNFQFTCFPPTFVVCSAYSAGDLQIFMRPLFSLFI